MAVLGKDLGLGLGCAKLEAPIRLPAGVVRWEVGGGSGVQERERGLSWAHGANKEALPLLRDCNLIPFPVWASVFPWAKSGG